MKLDLAFAVDMLLHMHLDRCPVTSMVAGYELLSWQREQGVALVQFGSDIRMEALVGHNCVQRLGETVWQRGKHRSQPRTN